MRSQTSKASPKRVEPPHLDTADLETAHLETAHLNMAVIIGTVTNDAVTRELADGTVVVQFDLRVAGSAGSATSSVSVPISWSDPSPASAAAVQPGAALLVAGRVVRRFFRSGGTTQSRTEVVVDTCLPARSNKRVRTVLANAAARIDERCVEMA